MVELKRILCAFDGSDQSLRAFDHAVDLAQRYGASVLVLAVARLPEFPVEVETEAVLENADQFYEGQFMLLRERAGTAPVKISYDVAVGHPAEQVPHRADAEGADLIVMGHRGQSRVQEWLLGSVAKRVLSYAPCAVLIVR